MAQPVCYGIIPSRYASSRFPGKPLAQIAGKPMIWHVYAHAKACSVLRSVTLATDDERILHVAEQLGMNCVMTRPDHASGTDRIYEAAMRLGIPDDAVVVNIQGDEPMLMPDEIAALVAPFMTAAGSTVQATTLATPIDAARALSPNQVKVVTDANGNALYFSRARIPFLRDADPDSHTYLGHIGIYAFRAQTLLKFVSLPQSPLEQLEKLEQLRLIENGIPIRVVLTADHKPGVDTPEDLERVRRLWPTQTAKHLSPLTPSAS